MTIPPHLSGQQLYNFIGGRRRHNFARQMKAIGRRWKVLRYWAENPHLRKADLARHFGVSRATITRDIQAIQSEAALYRDHVCPLCDGGGRIDTGPDLATMVEIVSDIQRSFPHLGDIM